MQISSISVIKTTEKKSCYVAIELIALSLLVGILKNFDIYYNGYIQTHCQKNKKIKRADQILPEVSGTTLNSINPNLSNPNTQVGPTEVRFGQA
jgi:hypothetical protein